MLKSVKITNYKSIDDEIELSFEPVIKKELNENNRGKVLLKSIYNIF